MSTIELKVKLDTANADALDVTGNQKIDKKDVAQTIRWKLDSSLTDASFLPLAVGSPGFEWISNPPPGASIFSAPEVARNGKSLTIRDTHDGTASKGAWAYVLRVIFEGKLYETAFNLELPSSAPQSGKRITSAILVSNNPIIINR